MQTVPRLPGAPCSPTAISTLIEALSAAGPLIDESVISAALERPVQLSDVDPWLRFDPDTRCRSLIYRARAFEILVVGWLPGQRSALHDHGPSRCVFRVLQGIAEEQRYRSSRAPVPYRTLALGTDTLARVVPGEAHAVGNFSRHHALVTLHVYSPPLADAPPVRVNGAR